MDNKVKAVAVAGVIGAIGVLGVEAYKKHNTVEELDYAEDYDDTRLFNVGMSPIDIIVYEKLKRIYSILQEREQDTDKHIMRAFNKLVIHTTPGSLLDTDRILMDYCAKRVEHSTSSVETYKVLDLVYRAIVYRGSQRISNRRQAKLKFSLISTEEALSDLRLLYKRFYRLTTYEPTKSFKFSIKAAYNDLYESKLNKPAFIKLISTTNSLLDTAIQDYIVHKSDSLYESIDIIQRDFVEGVEDILKG